MSPVEQFEADFRACVAKLRLARRERRLTQKQLGRLGCSADEITQHECERSTSWRFLCKYADILGFDVILAVMPREQTNGQSEDGSGIRRQADQGDTARKS